MTTDTRLHRLKNLGSPPRGAPYWMGIVNVTPDSFSDGGRYFAPDKALEHALSLVHLGATIIDIGAASTRPGALALTPREEWTRLEPVLSRIKKILPEHVLVSLDSYNPETCDLAAQMGSIDIINDVYACQKLSVNGVTTASVAASFRLGLIVMHMQGEPRSMQSSPQYVDVVDEVKSFLSEKLAFCSSQKVPWVAIDPGIGFGKTFDHNFELFRNLKELSDLKAPVVVGLSRKRFVRGFAAKHQIPCENERELDELSKILEWKCVEDGVQIVRSHRMP